MLDTLISPIHASFPTLKLVPAPSELAVTVVNTGSDEIERTPSPSTARLVPTDFTYCTPTGSQLLVPDPVEK